MPTAYTVTGNVDATAGGGTSGARTASKAAPNPPAAKSSGTTLKLFEAFTYFTIGVDLVDVGLDFSFVAELAKEGFNSHAAWLGICATIALVLELWAKVQLRRDKKRQTAGNTCEDFDCNKEEGQSFYILFCALL